MMMMIKYYLFILMMIYNPQLATSSRSHNNLTDMESLLAFRSGVSDPDGFLAANWTTNVTSFCNSWFGVQCSRRHPNRVVGLDLHNSSLYGIISPNLGNLSFLSYLNLRHNNLFGTIPASLCQLPRLAYMNMSYNDLSGTIPPNILNMSSLAVLSIAYNNLSGPLPDSNFNCNSLRYFALTNNSLSGSIPSHFAKCPQLEKVGLTYNQLTGRIPYEFGNITTLQVLYLGGNELSGNIPASIGNLTMLQNFSIYSNNIQGQIPQELGKLTNLYYLQLCINNLTGPIPTSLLNASNLAFLELFENNLSGNVPTDIGKYWPKLTIFSIQENKLTGGLQFITSLSNCRSLEYIKTGYNKFHGILPDSVGNLSTGLIKLDIRESYIIRELPNGIGNLTSLLYLNLEGNELTGELPPIIFSKMKALQGLFLGVNKISGHISFELGLMASLNILDLSYNTLSGPIPYSLGNITTLSYLDISFNMLSSHIPDTLWNLRGLLTLDLSNNSFDGIISPKIKNLLNLDVLDLSKNHLSGYLPISLGELQMLSHLNLSSNSFYGQIPISVKGLINIKYIDLSYNSLSGTIPEVLANLSDHLLSLNLSFNRLEGKIPPFSNLSILSLEGNLALCGAVQLDFPPCPSANNSKSKIYLIKYILPPMIALLVLLTACFCYSLFYRRKKTKLEQDMALNVGPKTTVSYLEIVRATNNFSDSNLLGRGSFASVFKEQINDGSTTAAIKVLNMEHEAALKSFDAECNVLSQALHRNLVKIISTCSNLDFKALVLEYMPNGSLEQWLYSHNNFLNMLQRLNILVDVSLALEYLHHGHPNVILHLDLKPSNVLLDEDMTARLSDFGISKLLLGDSKSILSASSPGTFGYIAPEYGSTGNVSKKSDVYSFGILVLEMLTRKKPSDAIFSGGLTLREWVSDVYPNAVQEIVDPNLLIDPAGDVDECLTAIIHLGLQCSSISPTERMPIKDVVPILEKIRAKYLSQTSTLSQSV